jgi:hypothetical protein
MLETQSCAYRPPFSQSVKRSNNINNRIEPNFRKLYKGLLNYR